MVKAKLFQSKPEKKFCLIFGSNLVNYRDGIILAFFHEVGGMSGAVHDVEFTEDATRELYLPDDGGYEELFTFQIHETICQQFIQVAKLNHQLFLFVDTVVEPALKKYKEEKLPIDAGS